jgi:hypothetical protein
MRRASICLMVLASVGCGRLGQEPAVGAQAPAVSPARPDRADPTTSWSDERIADYMRQRSGVWFATHEQVARYVKSSR